MYTHYKIKEWQPVTNHKTIQAYFTVKFVHIGLQIKRCMLHKSGDSRWITFSSREYVNTDGSVGHSNMISFFEDEYKYRFKEDILKIIDNTMLGPVEPITGPVWIGPKRPARWEGI